MSKFVRLLNPATNETRDVPRAEFISRTKAALKQKGYEGWTFVKEHDEAIPDMPVEEKEVARLRSLPKDELVAELRAEIASLAERVAVIERGANANG